jgi:dTDP-4-dehydrorhamnose reductase
MLRILLTGANGQIGWELRRTLATLGELRAVDRQAMDLADPQSVRRGIREFRPQVIVNAAAHTAVDRAESEPALAAAVNAEAPALMATEAARIGALLVHYSTDYVFDGAKESAYDEEDRPNPLNVYGRTKLAGETAIREAGIPHLIFRTSWVYAARGKNFMLTILRLARERDELKVVDDQIGAPTWSRMVAEATAQILARLKSPDGTPKELGDRGGVYNLSAAGRTSWCGFANAILDAVRATGLGNAGGFRVRRIVPIPTHEYPTPAQRPKNSVLSNAKLLRTFGIALPDWTCSLRLCVEDLLYSSR